LIKPSGIYRLSCEDHDAVRSALDLAYGGYIVLLLIGTAIWCTVRWCSKDRICAAIIYYFNGDHGSGVKIYASIDLASKEVFDTVSAQPSTSHAFCLVTFRVVRFGNCHMW